MDSHFCQSVRRQSSNYFRGTILYNQSQSKNRGHFIIMNSQAGDQKGIIKSEIDGLINKDRVVIFSKESCPYCVDARNVFDEIGQSYSEVDLNRHPNGQEVQDALKEMTGASTVPRVFVDGKCIGGGTDTVELYKTGKLEQILKPNDSQVDARRSRSESGRGENPG